MPLDALILAHRGAAGLAGEDNTLDVTISVVETLGDKMDVFVQTGSHDHIVCRVEASRELRDGLQLSMHLNMNQVHVFEPGDAGVNVSLDGAGDQASAA